jgi:hypothetical protein
MGRFQERANCTIIHCWRIDYLNVVSTEASSWTLKSNNFGCTALLSDLHKQESVASVVASIFLTARSDL